jgi:hypothetical protein
MRANAHLRVEPNSPVGIESFSARVRIPFAIRRSRTPVFGNRVVSFQPLAVSRQ